MSCPNCRSGVTRFTSKEVNRIKVEGGEATIVGETILWLSEKKYVQCGACAAIWLLAGTETNLDGNPYDGYQIHTVDTLARVLESHEVPFVIRQIEQEKAKRDPTQFPYELQSPDKTKKLIYTDLNNTQPSAPKSGRTSLALGADNFPLIDHSGGPAVWSADSRYVAYPVWLNPERIFIFPADESQKLILVDTLGKVIKRSKTIYARVHLEKWNGIILQGKQTVQFQQQSFSINMTRLTYEYEIGLKK